MTVVFETNKGERLDSGNATVLDLAPKQTKEVEAVSLNADANARLFKCRVTEVTRTPEGQPETRFSSAFPSDSPSATWRAGRDVDGEALGKCRTDSRTVRTAEEAFFARAGRYATSTEELVSAGMLSEPSSLHRVELYPPDAPSTTDQYGSSGSPYFLVVTAPMCGVPGHRVGQMPTDY
ncbi:MAG TPA: hypothetical protein VMZ51_06415 [Acidimicrobiales bacterium]|nr:hypothetical protein [Acidimicrobiales bacterium]